MNIHELERFPEFQKIRELVKERLLNRGVMHCVIAEIAGEWLLAGYSVKDCEKWFDADVWDTRIASIVKEQQEPGNYLEFPEG